MREREQLNRDDVLVIDEAGMVSSQQMTRVLKAVEHAGAKAVLVGDAMQLQLIQASAAFRPISERVGFAELVGVRRQRQAWAREASRKVEEGLDAYAQNGRLVKAETRAALIERIVADWTDARRELLQKSADGENAPRLRGDELLVLAHTNEVVKRLNESLRKGMMEEGALTGAREFQTARGLGEVAAGDRIIFLENALFLNPAQSGSGNM